MDNNSIKIERLKIVLISIVLFLMLLLEINRIIVQNKYHEYKITKDVEVKHNGKIVYKGDIDYYKMKNVKDEDNIEMKMYIPENDIVNPAIIFDNINTGVKIFLDGKEIYSIGEDTPKGGIVCHFNNKVALGEAEEGQELVMSIRVMNAATLNRLPGIKLMNAKDLEYQFVADKMVYYIISVLYLLIAIFCAVIYIVGRKFVDYSYLIISVMCVVAALYTLSTFQVTQIFMDNTQIDAYLEYFNKHALPAFLALYVFTKDTNKRKRYIHLALFFVMLVFGIVMIYIQYNRIKYLNEYMNEYLVLSIIIIVDALLQHIDKMKKDGSMRLTIISGICFGAIFMTYAFLHLFFRNLSSDIIILLPVIILLYFVFVCVESAYNIAKTLINSANKQAIVELAYLDALTGINNRRGIINYASKIEKNKNPYVLTMFDLNDLKKINDKYGHIIGDEMIVTFANTLKEVYIDGICGRIGGDEFVTIIEEKFDNDNLLRKLEEKVEEYNLKRKDEDTYIISYAHGSAMYAGEYVSDINVIIGEADSKMYKDKRQMKQKS